RRHSPRLHPEQPLTHTIDSNGLSDSPPHAARRLHRPLTGRLLLPQRDGRLPDADAQALERRADQRSHRHGPGQAVCGRQAVERRADQRTAGHEPEQTLVRRQAMISDL
ncbi:hypothetical protein PMAYCL1PPCAC_11231, partial [Pristionchus mayeri]